ncbi:MAG: hypothetical protein JWQ90_580 [Hydrocarboniphaga sp.]|uniref:hypothetical protein n=1 Tax=Hydrocarboniphaga sp. TaxID=2033016 RepID=UPI0026339615|nr:hypothetical protein [Hydrocarboniphaga sp.]MDB5968130.1 hypothetical protein [Hydrocarboniphaga sp.]
MSMTNRRALTFAAGLGSLLLSACSGVGDGNSLQSLVVVPAAETTLTFDDLKAGNIPDATAYQCMTSGLTLYGLFTKDNSFGNFTDRATWSSANPDIVKVSNADIAVPGQDDLFYIRGTLVPTGTGSTVVTAEYLDRTASITVNVAAPTEITLDTVDPRIAVNSQVAIPVSAKLDGIRRPLINPSTPPVVAFDPVNDALATVAASTVTGFPVVTGLAEGGPLTLNVTLPICGQVLSTTVQVAKITTLHLQHEAGFTGDLVVGTNEALKTMADFGAGPEQDVTSQSSYAVDVTDSTATTRIASSLNFVSALAAGDLANVVAKCCTHDRNADGDVLDDDETAAATSDPLPITPVTGTLTAFGITPADGSVEQYTNQQFTVAGTFDGDRSQPITRFVTWAVTDPSTATATTAATTSPLFSIGSGTLSVNAGLSLVQFPPVGAKITAPTPLTVTATLLSSVQPDTDLPAQSTTFTLTPLAP